MYRTIISVLLCVSAVASAPQDNTNVTYIKIIPTVAQDKPIPKEPPPPVEDVPLSVPVSLNKEPDSESEQIENDITTEDDQPDTTTEVQVTTTTTNKPVIITTRKSGFRSNPRFISKLSYYNNANSENPTNNFIEKFSKRTYKSKCRCAKIWNCPKLQISVPRCPNEYFMCCF